MLGGTAIAFMCPHHGCAMLQVGGILVSECLPITLMDAMAAQPGRLGEVLAGMARALACIVSTRIVNSDIKDAHTRLTEQGV